MLRACLAGLRGRRRLSCVLVEKGEIDGWLKGNYGFQSGYVQEVYDT